MSTRGKEQLLGPRRAESLRHVIQKAFGPTKAWKKSRAPEAVFDRSA